MQLQVKISKPRTIFIPAIGIIFLAITIYSLPHSFHKTFVPCRQEASPDKDISLKEGPLMTGFEFSEYNGGKKVFTIKAERFYIRNRKVKPFNFRIALGKSVEMEDVEVAFYKDGKPASYLNSRFAIMDMRKKDVIFEGEPSLITEDRNTLSAKKFVWNNFKNRLEAKGNCILGKEGRRYSADVVNTDIELKDFTIVEEKEDIGFLKLKGRR